MALPICNYLLTGIVKERLPRHRDLEGTLVIARCSDTIRKVMEGSVARIPGRVQWLVKRLLGIDEKDQEFSLDEFFRLVGMDCWAMTTTKNNEITIHFNSNKDLTEKEIRNQIIKDKNYILKDEPDTIEVYLYKENSYKVVAKREENNYTFQLFASEGGLRWFS